MKKRDKKVPTDKTARIVACRAAKVAHGAGGCDPSISQFDIARIVST
jgi:hypothetical protein